MDKDRKDHRNPNNATGTVLLPFLIFFFYNSSWWTFHPR